MTRLTRGLVVAFAIVVLNDTTAAQRPNIVFIYSDDQAAWAVGASGNRDAKTPNMDRVAREGATLVNAFTVTPVCSPSRAGLMASRYGTEVGITDWIQPKTEPELGLNPSFVLWPELLQRNGYATGLIGKWHLGVPPQFHPTKNGFDYFMGFLEGGTTPRNPLLEQDGQSKQFDGFTSDILTDRAIRFIDQNRTRPFALCLHFRSPHAPYSPVAEHDSMPFRDLNPTIPTFPGLESERVKRLTGEYLASVAEVDRNFGRVLDHLDRLQLTQQTVVIFSSDHGYNIGHHGVWHKGNGQWIVSDPPSGTTNIPRGQRPNMFDTSLRVPAMVRWPGAIRPGTVVNQTVSNLDWYPTLLAIAGADVPHDQIVRGRNFLPILRGETVDWDNSLFAQYSTHHSSQTQMRVIRTPHWKLMRDFLNSGRDELYNLSLDPQETQNLISAEAPDAKQALKDLSARMLEAMRQISDPALPPSS